MKRRHFIQSLGLSSLFTSLTCSTTQAAILKRPSALKDGKKQVCSLTRRVFEVGKPMIIEVKAPKDFIQKIRLIDIKSDDGEYAFSPQKRAKFEIKDDRILISYIFPKEQMYSIFFYPIGKETSGKRKGKNKLPMEYQSVYALEGDLYKLRPFKGDVHMHSRFSDGRNFIEEMGIKCLELGFGFQALSDHRTNKGAKLLCEKFNALPISMRCFVAEECHKARPHIHSFGASECITDYIAANQDAFDARALEIVETLPDGLSKEEALAVAKSEAEFEIIKKFGGLSGLNHPFWRMGERSIHLTKRVVEVLCKRHKFDYFELVNSSCGDDSSDLAIAALFEYGCNDMVCLATSDAHSKEKLGAGYTMVFASSNSWEDIRNSIMDKKSVAVEVFDKTLPRIFGKIRYMQYAYFLYQQYFPIYDEICKQQAKLLGKCIKDKYSKKSKKALADKSEELSLFVKDFFGA